MDCVVWQSIQHAAQDVQRTSDVTRGGAPSAMCWPHGSLTSRSGCLPLERSPPSLYAVYDGLWLSDVLLFVGMYLITALGVEAGLHRYFSTARSTHPNR